MQKLNIPLHGLGGNLGPMQLISLITGVIDSFDAARKEEEARKANEEIETEWRTLQEKGYDQLSGLLNKLYLGKEDKSLPKRIQTLVRDNPDRSAQWRQMGLDPSKVGTRGYQSDANLTAEQLDFLGGYGAQPSKGLIQSRKDIGVELADKLKALEETYTNQTWGINQGASNSFKDLTKQVTDMVRATGEEAVAGLETRGAETVKGYEDRYNRAMKLLEGMGRQEKADVYRNAAEASASTAARMASVGLGGTSIVPSLNMGINRERASELARINERLQGQRLATDTTLSGDVINAKDRAALDVIGAKEQLGANLSNLRDAYGRQQIDIDTQRFIQNAANMMQFGASDVSRRGAVGMDQLAAIENFGNRMASLPMQSTKEIQEMILGITNAYPDLAQTLQTNYGLGQNIAGYPQRWQPDFGDWAANGGVEAILSMGLSGIGTPLAMTNMPKPGQVPGPAFTAGATMMNLAGSRLPSW